MVSCNVPWKWDIAWCLRQLSLVNSKTSITVFLNIPGEGECWFGNPVIHLPCCRAMTPRLRPAPGFEGMVLPLIQRLSWWGRTEAEVLSLQLKCSKAQELQSLNQSLTSGSAGYLCVAQGPPPVPLVLTAWVPPSALISSRYSMHYAWWLVLMGMMQTLSMPPPHSHEPFPNHSPLPPS